MDTNENTKELIKDLCSRLPYGVKVLCLRDFNRKWYNLEMVDIGDNEVYLTTTDESYTNRYVEIDEVKPYLFPLSSMSNKDLIEFLQIRGMNLNSDELKTFRNGETAIVATLPSYSRHIDWLNAHHFDYRGLIEKGLAIDCTNLNIY